MIINGWTFTPTTVEDTKGFTLCSPRIDGVSACTAIFEDTPLIPESLAECALYAVLADLATKEQKA